MTRLVAERGPELFWPSTGGTLIRTKESLMPEPYIATKPIHVGTALAHAVGDEVPDENVEANGWQDSVARASSKAAKAAQAPQEPAVGPSTP